MPITANEILSVLSVLHSNGWVLQEDGSWSKLGMSKTRDEAYKFEQEVQYVRDEWSGCS